MNKYILILLLISTSTITIKLTPEQQLKVQEEKDYQEFRLKIIAACSTVALAAIAAYIQVYLAKK